MFVGIDVSKDWFDASNQSLLTSIPTNINLPAFKTFDQSTVTCALHPKCGVVPQ